MEHEAVGLVAELGAALEGSAAGLAVRRSLWLYPIASILHILGVGLLLGSIVALDLRFLGAASAVPLRAAADLLIPIAATGLLLQIPTGIVMLLADASHLLTNPLMQVKLLLVLAGVANVALFHRLAGPKLAGLEAPLPMSLRLGALVSLIAWPTVAILGRAIAYL